MIKKLLLVASVLVIPVLFSFSSSASAVGVYNPFAGVCERSDSEDRETASSAVCSEKRTDDPISGPKGIILKVVDIIALIAGSIAIIMLIISGIKFVTSNGDSNGVSSAKNTILQVFIGLAIIILARFIITFIVTRI